MASDYRNPCLREVPEDLRRLVAECQRRRGTTGAARAIGVSRPTVLAILAGTGVQSGTVAILREYARRRQAERTMGPGVAAIDDPRRGGMF